MTASRSRIAPALAMLGFAFAVAVGAPATARAADADFGEPTAEATWGVGIELLQPVTLRGEVRRVEILLDFPGGYGPVVDELQGGTREGEQTLSHTISAADGHITPNTTLTARWRVVGEDGSEVVGPPVTVTYADTRFEWRVREGDVVRVHWYEGPDSFGDRALAIAERTVVETSELLGTTEEEPVDFFVYADEQAFYEAIGPGSRENVGGLAIASLRSLYALITPDQIDADWVGVVIPHETVHLVFDTATDNPYHLPPRWLNEGVAVYLSEGYGLTDRALVEQAASDGSLMPLEALTGQFPTSSDRFFLAYSESVSAVDFLVRQHGRDAMVALVRSYATGLTDDEAFERAIGMNVKDFDVAWREEVGAGEPVVHGPVDPPPGPLPPGWTTAEGSPGPTMPPGSRPSLAPTGPGSAGAPTPATDPTGGTLPLAIAAIAAVAVAVLALYLLLVHRASRKAAPSAASADWGGGTASAPAEGVDGGVPGAGPVASLDAAPPVAAPAPPGALPADASPSVEAPAPPGALPADAEPAAGAEPGANAEPAAGAEPAANAQPPEEVPPAGDPGPRTGRAPAPGLLPAGELWASGWSTSRPPASLEPSAADASPSPTSEPAAESAGPSETPPDGDRPPRP